MEKIEAVIEKKEICKKMLSRVTVSVPALQKEFSLSYVSAREVVADLVDHGFFECDGGVDYYRTETGKQAEKEIKRKEREAALAKKREEQLNSVQTQQEEEEDDVPPSSDEKDQARQTEDLLVLIKKRREELLKRIHERQEAEKKKATKKEDKADAPFGSRRFEPNLQVAAKQISWERLDEYSFRLHVEWLEFSSGEDCKFKVIFREDGTMQLTDERTVWDASLLKDGDEAAARVRLSAAERSWDQIQCDEDSKELCMETSVTHLYADIMRFFALLDRVLD